MLRTVILLALISPLVAACTTTSSDYCAGAVSGNLNSAINTVENRLGEGCTYHFDQYFENLLAIAADNPDRDNVKKFSDHLMRVNEMGVITRRQARDLYNRYFNIKFVAMSGDFNTCAQTCPVKSKVLASMRSELQDKELGLLRASDNAQGYYRADHLLKETTLVREATCKACAAGTAR